jgi:hypothetical protein
MPFVAWHHHDHGTVEGVDCGPWKVEDPDERWRRVLVLFSAQGDYSRDQARPCIEVVTLLEAKRERTKVFLSQVIDFGQGEGVNRRI